MCSANTGQIIVATLAAAVTTYRTSAWTTGAGWASSSSYSQQAKFGTVFSGDVAFGVITDTTKALIDDTQFFVASGSGKAAGYVRHELVNADGTNPTCGPGAAADGAAEQFVERLPRRFADDVPHRHFHAACQEAAQRVLGVPCFEIEWIAPHGLFAQQVLRRHEEVRDAVIERAEARVDEVRAGSARATQPDQEGRRHPQEA